LQIARPQFHRQFTLHPSDDLHFGDARDPAQPPRDVGVGQPRQLRSGQPLRRQHQRHDRQVRRIEPRQDRLLHLRRQLVPDRGDLVADFLRRLLQVLLELEERDDHAVAIQRVRLDLVDAADARDPFFDAIDNLAFDALRGGAGIRHRHHHDRVLHIGELVGLQQCQCEDAEHAEREHHDGRDDRPPDCEIGDEHDVSLAEPSARRRPAGACPA
jgi:hypothetical protein